MSRFDRAVATVLGCLALATLVAVWRGDRVGAAVVDAMPAADAIGVSTAAVIRVRLNDTVVPGGPAAIALVPAVPGTQMIDGDSVTFTPAAPLAPGATYTVTLQAGIRTASGRTLRRGRQWSFRTGATAVVFLRRDATDRDQLYSVAAAGGEARSLTHEALGVWDFAVAPDGATIAYSTIRQSGGSDIKAIDRTGGEPRPLLGCPDAQCDGMTWAPDGRTMVYEKRTLPPGGLAAGPPKLWWLDASSGDSVAVFDDSQHLGFGARFAPDGKRIAYLGPDDGNVRIYTIDAATETSLDSQMGEPASWRPDSRALAVTNLVVKGEQFFVHTLRLDLDDAGALASPIDISGREDVEDSQPAWSPDGGRLALARRIRYGTTGPQGRGIWVMAPDGSGASPLTQDPTAHFGAPIWSPDGRTILCQRVDLAQPGAKPAVWLIDVASGAAAELAADGFRPAWLP